VFAHAVHTRTLRLGYRSSFIASAEERDLWLEDSCLTEADGDFLRTLFHHKPKQAVENIQAKRSVRTGAADLSGSGARRVG